METHDTVLVLGSISVAAASKYRTCPLISRMGTVMLLKSTVPTEAPASMGVKTK